MQRVRTVTLLDVSAVAGHHAMPAALLLFIIIAIFIIIIITSSSCYLKVTVVIRQLNNHLFGKELFIRVTMRVFRERVSLRVSLFPLWF